MPKAPTTPRKLALLYAGCAVIGAFLIGMTAWVQHLLYVSNVLQGFGYFLLPTAIGLAIGTLVAYLLQGRATAELAAHCDPLTGLPNRAGLSRAIESEIDRADRYGGAVGLLMFDVDKFKDINDTLGHSAGDQVLLAITRAVWSVTRRTDVFARWAGDEFVVVAPQTGITGCRSLAEKIREAIASWPMPADIPVTVSIGVSHFVTGDSERTLIRRADEALYRAKRAGRNRTDMERFLRSTGSVPRV